MLRYVLLALVVTEAAELLMAAILGIRRFYDLRMVFLVNLMTNPLISVLYITSRIFLGQQKNGILFAAEIVVWAAEAVVYKHCIEEKCSPAVLSAAANLASVLAGYLVGMWF